MNKWLTMLMCASWLTAGVAQADGFLTLRGESVEWDAWCRVVYVNGTTTIELGVFDPVNPSFGPGGARDVAFIGGFQCRLVPGDGVFVTGVDFPVAAFNAGNGGDLTVTFAEPVPVGIPKTVLASVDLFFAAPTGFVPPDEVFSPCYLNVNTGIDLVPTSPALIPGAVSLLDAEDPVDPIVPLQLIEGTDFDLSLMQDPAVPVPGKAWGTIKALYR